MTQQPSATLCLWQQLQGTWHLTRKLHSINAAEPSGNCRGTATFKARPASIFVDENGVLQNASQEMLYSENGDLEMIAPAGSMTAPNFSFSRQYVWRLQNDGLTRPEITIWFVKPGTDKVDYVFHKVLPQHVTDTSNGDRSSSSMEYSGGHLCVDDYYSSTYTFHMQEHGDCTILQNWDMLHEVNGPKKDQVIETYFTRA